MQRGVGASAELVSDRQRLRPPVAAGFGVIGQYRHLQAEARQQRCHGTGIDVQRKAQTAGSGESDKGHGQQPMVQGRGTGLSGFAAMAALHPQGAGLLRCALHEPLSQIGFDVFICRSARLRRDRCLTMRLAVATRGRSYRQSLRFMAQCVTG